MKKGKELLGKRIKEIRKARKMTQPELAEIIDVDPKYISRLETGTSTPSLDTIINIADAFDTSLCELFDFSNMDEKDELISHLIQKLKMANTNSVRLVYTVANAVLNYS